MTDQNKEKRLRVYYTADGYLEEEEVTDYPGAAETETPSKWLKFFCPHDFCEITSPTQLP